MVPLEAECVAEHAAAAAGGAVCVNFQAELLFAGLAFTLGNWQKSNSNGEGEGGKGGEKQEYRIAQHRERGLECRCSMSELETDVEKS